MNNGRHLLFPLLLLAATFAVYGGIYDHAFLPMWDDDLYVANNEAIRGITFANLRTIFTSTFVGNYAPVHLLSYMMDYLLWGLRPGGYLFGNVVLHGVNGLLFYRLLCRQGLLPFAAAVAAAIFLLHPVQVESVAWVAQRKNVLAMTFFLTALLSYLRYREGGAGRGRAYVFMLVFLLLALLTKSVTMIFPLVIIVADVCFPGAGRRPVTDKVAPTVLAIVVAAVAAVTQSKVERPYPGGTALTGLYTMLPVPFLYLRDCFFPSALSPHYMVTVRQTPDGAVLGAALLLLLMAALAAVLYRKNRRALFFAALFFIALLPVSQVVPLIPLKNDRYLYFPLLGFAGVVGEGVQFLRHKCRRPVVTGIVALAIILPLPFLSFRQTAIWKNELTLWEHAVLLDPDNQLGWLMLMKNNTLRGRGGEAREAAENFQRLKEKYGPLRGWEHE